MKKRYEKPQLEVLKLIVQNHFLENSGETEDPMSKESTFTWNDDDVNNLWGDEPEEE